jgi:hypothetical protein
MEPVSGIASVAGILEFSLVLTEHFSDLFQRFRDAHTDLDTLKGRLTCVRAEIASITQLSVQSEDWLLSPPAKIELVAALKAAEQDLIRLEGELNRLPRKLSGAKRVRWALVDHGRAQKLPSRLREAESSLTNVLLLFLV